MDMRRFCKNNVRYALVTPPRYTIEKVGTFPHTYLAAEDGNPCPTHLTLLQPPPPPATSKRPISSSDDDDDYNIPTVETTKFTRIGGVTGLDFQKSGHQIASITEHGCLSIHKFEKLLAGADDETDHSFHHYVAPKLGDVKWNPLAQHKVACSSLLGEEIRIYNLSSASPTQPRVLKTSSPAENKGISSLTFSPTDFTRLFASSMDGNAYMWDIREPNLPVLEFTSKSHDSLNSIEYDDDDRAVYGASVNGQIFEWDIRGGKKRKQFQLGGPSVYPRSSMRVKSMLSDLLLFKEYDALVDIPRPLRVRTELITDEIHSIKLNSVRGKRLAFNLDNGWSGVIDMAKSKVSHLHFASPAYDESVRGKDVTKSLRRPVWLPTGKEYIVGGLCAGICVLDFSPEMAFTLHANEEDSVWHPESDERLNCDGWPDQTLPEIILKTPFEVNGSKIITSCAADPEGEYIVAGAKNSKLKVIKIASQVTDKSCE